MAAGLAGLGRYTRFVSYSVMIGFLTGIAVNIVCGQIADLTGAPAHGAYPLAKAVDVIIHPKPSTWPATADRGRTTLGATFIKIITDYAGRLADADGRLYLSGLQPDLTERLRRTGSIQGPLRAVEATPVIGESTHTAYLDAEAWLVKKHDAPDSPEAVSDGGQAQVTGPGRRHPGAGLVCGLRDRFAGVDLEHLADSTHDHRGACGWGGWVGACEPSAEALPLVLDSGEGTGWLTGAGAGISGSCRTR